MAEYLAPGVYVEEYDARPGSIPGVSKSTDDLVMGSLASELRALVQRFDPNWTDRGASDPGVTVLEAFAWLSGALFFYRSVPLSAQGRRAAMRALAMLSGLIGPCAASSGTLTRPHFFAGQVLDPADLQAEQDYHREKQRRHYRALHGVGIVDGLEISVEATADAPDGRLHVQPGCAIDPRGDLIILCQRVAVALPQTAEPIYVSLRQEDIPCGPVASPAGELAYSRIEEASVVALVDTVPAPAIALGRLLRSEGKWGVDQCFAPQRVPQGSS